MRNGIQAIVAVLIGVAAIAFPPSITLGILAIVAFLLLLTSSPLVGMVLFLILSPLRTLIATESAFQLPLDIGLLSFAVFIGYWALHRIIHKQSVITFRWHQIYLPLAGFIIASGLTVFNAVSLGSWINEWLKWIIIVVIIHISLRSFATDSYWQWMVFGLVSAALANAIIGLYIFFGGSGADHLVILNRFFRAFGTFGQPNPFGGFMGMVIPLALMFAYAKLRIVVINYLSKRSINTQDFALMIFYGSAALLLVAGLFASWSRGAWLSFVGSIGMMAFALPRKLYHSILLAGAAIIIVLGLWFGGFLPQAIVARVASSTEEFFAFDDVRGVDVTSANYAVVERLAHWQAALNMARQNPYFGVGLGNYEIVYDDYRLLNWREPLGHAHNYYLNILGETGIIGFATYLALWIGIFRLTWYTRRHPDLQARCVVIGLLGTWTYISIHSLLDNLYVNNLFLHLGVLLSLLAILYKQVASTTEVRQKWNKSLLETPK